MTEKWLGTRFWLFSLYSYDNLAWCLGYWMHPTTSGVGLSEKTSDKSADWACKGLLETVSDASAHITIQNPHTNYLRKKKKKVKIDFCMGAF